MKICVVTTARSEYGLLRWIMQEIKDSSDLTLQLVVTGGHLVESQGFTFRHIEEDGFHIDEKIDMYLSSTDRKSLTKSMGLLTLSFSDTLARLKPDLLLVLGDRYELLPLCSTALVQNIKIAHISGGDITEGAIDNKVRHAVTQLSDYHFPGNSDSAHRIAGFIGSRDHIYDVGEPGIDNLFRIPTESKEALAPLWGMDPSKKWIICTLHPETNSASHGDIERAHNLIDFFKSLRGYNTMITAANLDFGGEALNRIYMQAAEDNPDIFYKSSLGQKNYTNFLRHADFMTGNSSSGIVEALSFNLPVINIGDRQKGRLTPGNIITVDGTLSSLNSAYSSIEKLRETAVKTINPYGSGNTSVQVVKILEKIAKDLHE